MPISGRSLDEEPETAGGLMTISVAESSVVWDFVFEKKAQRLSRAKSREHLKEVCELASRNERMGVQASVVGLRGGEGEGEGLKSIRGMVRLVGRGSHAE